MPLWFPVLFPGYSSDVPFTSSVSGCFSYNKRSGQFLLFYRVAVLPDADREDMTHGILWPAILVGYSGNFRRVSLMCVGF